MSDEEVGPRRSIPASLKGRWSDWIAGRTIRQRLFALLAMVMVPLLTLTTWQLMSARRAHDTYDAIVQEYLRATNGELGAEYSIRLDEARVEHRRRELVTYGVTLGALLLLSVVMPLCLRPHYRGIEHLTNVAQRISARDFAVRPRHVLTGELGELSQALVTMQQEISRHARELEVREIEASAANRAKSMFLATMSHEIRTPLVGVIGMLELLGYSRLDEQQRQQFDVVRQSAYSLLEVVGDVLDYSKIEAGKLEINRETISVRDLVSRVIAMFSATAQAKCLPLTVAIDPVLAPAQVVDGVRVTQVLRNFVANAVKFTERGAVTVAVRVVDNGLKVQRVTFAVADTGIGMTPEQLNRVFRPFAQAEIGTSRRFGGTGLGLAICLRLAEAMGARVQGESRPGVGTTMTLEMEMPLGDPANVVKAEPNRSLSENAASFGIGARPPTRLILLAEDHPINRQILTAQLQLVGYQVDVAEDGASAMERFARCRYDLVLTDLHMPGVDGFQLALAIRELERNSGRLRTPIVALTADAVREHLEHCFASGMDDYVCKPVSMRQLAEKLQRWLPGVDRERRAR